MGAASGGRSSGIQQRCEKRRLRLLHLCLHELLEVLEVDLLPSLLGVVAGIYSRLGKRKLLLEIKLHKLE